MAKKKLLISTAFLIFLMLVASIIPFLVAQTEACRRKRPRPPPLRTYIKKYFVYPDGSSIGAGLVVNLYKPDGTFVQTATTTAQGCTIFGSGIPDGTYVIKWSWQGVDYEETVTITCEKIIWEFTNELPYWTIEKQFYYEGTTIPPTYELDVTLYCPDGSSITKTTVDGFVSFEDLKAGDYTLEWVWGGVTKTEDVGITFETSSPVELTNYLDLKSGGGL